MPYPAIVELCLIGVYELTVNDTVVDGPVEIVAHYLYELGQVFGLISPAVLLPACPGSMCPLKDDLL